MSAKTVLLCILACIIQAANGHALSSNFTHSAENSNVTKAVQINRVQKPVDVNDSSAAQRTLAQMCWRRQWQLLRRQMRDCVKHSKDTSWNCFKISSLRIFDGLLGARVIPLSEGLQLMRLQDKEAAASEKSSDAYERQDLQHLTWFDCLAMRLAKTLTTHMLQVNLQQLTDAYMRSTQNTEAGKLPQLAEALGTARHRRHRFNVMMTMMFGATALGAVLVPMGFQLLSIVSGKALLLAKMALLLASINGLKRVANTGVHYGLYHVPGEQYNGYNDRGGMHHPRNVPPSIAMIQPFDMGMRK